MIHHCGPAEPQVFQCALRLLPSPSDLDRVFSTGTRMCRVSTHSNAVLEVVLQLPGREQIIAGKALFDARNVLTEMLAQIDSWMNGAGRARSK